MQSTLCLCWTLLPNTAAQDNSIGIIIMCIVIALHPRNETRQAFEDNPVHCPLDLSG